MTSTLDRSPFGSVALVVSHPFGASTLTPMLFDPRMPNVAIGVETSIWPLSTTLPPNIVKVPLMTLNRAEFDDELAS